MSTGTSYIGSSSGARLLTLFGEILAAKTILLPAAIFTVLLSKSVIIVRNTSPILSWIIDNRELFDCKYYLKPGDKMIFSSRATITVALLLPLSCPTVQFVVCYDVFFGRIK